MRFLSEDTIAREIVGNIKIDLDYYLKCGQREFSCEVEINNQLLCIDGILDYVTRYEEDVNYPYVYSATFDIVNAVSYDDMGNEIKFQYNIGVIENYVKALLEE